jgi:exosortase D (VPLPA-CTERM-specific)
MRAVRAVESRPYHIGTAVAGAVLTLAAIAAHGGAVLEAAKRWSTQEEYSHGFLIPVVTVWMLWTRRKAMVDSIGPPSWIGLVAILIASMLHLIGELSALFILSQIGLIVALLGVALCVGGVSLFQITFVPIAFLSFAIPLPYFLDSVVSWRLQLLSSEIGVGLIRALQIPVFLGGNVIDLGPYKLQVVEACSGLRYLYPLFSLGFLGAWLFQAPFWQRAIILLSTIPITIVMNSVRIVFVAVLVNRWGPTQAEGLLHLFEGWIIFLVCAGLLLAEIFLFNRFGARKPLESVFGVSSAEAKRTYDDRRTPIGIYPYIVSCFFLLILSGLSGFMASNRHEVIPDRTHFALFPVNLGTWRGRASSFDPQVEHFLGLTDYILSDYAQLDGHGINLYVAYYASQRKGLSPHSPQVCIPGNGWQIIDLERTSLRNPDDGSLLPINRVVVERETDKQLVYYWFEQRGRRIANEYLAKWHALEDAIFLNRSDGALVRLTTPIYPGEELDDADKRLQAFVSQLLRGLIGFLPHAPPAQAPGFIERFWSHNGSRPHA